MKINKKGILTVVSGFSGAGKGTIMKRLLRDYGETYALSISATTRAPRPGEEQGREYFFVETEEFESMIEEDKLLEYARYVNHYYGTPREYVESQLEKGKDVILEIEIQGALKIKEKHSDALLLFIAPPGAEELKRRLTGRGTEDEAAVTSRLTRAAEEAEGVENYDYFVINDELLECVEQVHAIIQCEHARCSRSRESIETMRQELKGFVSQQ